MDFHNDSAHRRAPARIVHPGLGDPRLGGALAGIAHEASGIRADDVARARGDSAKRAFQSRLLLRRQVESRSAAGALVYPNDDVAGFRHLRWAMPFALPMGRRPLA